MAKLSKEIKLVANETQNSVFESLQQTNRVYGDIDRTMEIIGGSSEDKVATRLGDAGKSLFRFIKLVNLKHPEVASLTKQKEWSDLSADVNNAMSGDVVDVDLTNKINTNYKTLLHQFIVKPRLVSDKDKREKLRDIKRFPKNVGLKSIYSQGEDVFFNKPVDFKLFVRFSNAHLDAKRVLEHQGQVFTAHAMPEVANKIRKRVQTIDDLKIAEYQGFQRIKPTDAAISLARMHGLKWHDINFINVPFKYFDDNIFWEDVGGGKTEEVRKNEELKKMFALKDKKIATFESGSSFVYQPRLYPLTSVPNPSKMVQEIIERVEHLPDQGDSPVFDYYWLLMPSITINHPLFKTQNGWQIKTKDGTRQFTNEYEASLALDIQLIENEYFMPVVIGERDGQCYFICLFV